MRRAQSPDNSEESSSSSLAPPSRNTPSIVTDRGRSIPAIAYLPTSIPSACFPRVRPTRLPRREFDPHPPESPPVNSPRPARDHCDRASPHEFFRPKAPPLLRAQISPVQKLRSVSHVPPYRIKPQPALRTQSPLCINVSPSRRPSESCPRSHTSPASPARRQISPPSPSCAPGDPPSNLPPVGESDYSPKMLPPRSQFPSSAIFPRSDEYPFPMFAPRSSDESSTSRVQFPAPAPPRPR